MKVYICRNCEDQSDECTGCVPDSTPDIFDKSIINRFCKHRKHYKPCWLRRKVVHEIGLY